MLLQYRSNKFLIFSYFLYKDVTIYYYESIFFHLNIKQEIQRKTLNIKKHNTLL
jgi:hypothetical protein